MILNVCKSVFAQMRIPLLAMALTVSAPHVRAGVPTTDGAAIAQLTQLGIQSLKSIGIETSQLNNIIETLSVAKEKLQLAYEEFESITGARGDIASLLPLDVPEAQIATDFASLWDVDGVSDEIASRFEDITTTFEFIDGNTRYEDKDESAREAIYDLEQASVKTELVVSETVFEDAAQAFERYATYRDALGGTSNHDLKAAIDLNTRVQIENGENIARLMQLIAAQGQSDAIERATAIRRQTRNALMLK